MDVWWIAGLAVLWVAMAEFAVGLFRLDAPRGERP